MLPDGCLLLGDGQTVVAPDGALLAAMPLPDGRLLLPSGLVWGAPSGPSPLPLPPGAAAVEDDALRLLGAGVGEEALRLAYEEECSAMAEDVALEAAYLEECALYSAELAAAGAGAAAPPPPPRPRVLTRPSLPPLDGAAREALLQQLYPRFRCRISGHRLTRQEELLPLVTANKAAAERQLRAQGVAPPYSVNALRAAFFASAECHAAEVGALGPVAPAGEGAPAALSRAWLHSARADGKGE